MDKLEGDIIALVDRRCPTFHVLAHDWGAAVAWQLTGNHADRVQTLSILSVPHPRAFQDAMLRGQLLHSWYMLLFQIPRLPEWLFGFNETEAFKKFGKSWMKVSDRLAERIRELFSEPGATTATVNWYRAMRYSLRSPARSSRVPTLFIWVTETPLSPARRGRHSQVRGGAVSLRDLRRCVPLIAEERPHETAALVLAHIAEYSA